MKDIFKEGSPESRHCFKNQSTPPKPAEKPQESEKPKVAFPETAKKIDNPSIGPNGKHLPKRQAPKGQPTLPLWPNN